MTLALKLGGSLVAVLALGWFAHFLGLGATVKLESEADAIRRAAEGQYGFEGVAAVVDQAGYSALVRDASNRHVLVSTKGNKFFTRLLSLPIDGRLDRQYLTLDVDDPGASAVTMNLGDQAQYWASGLRHIPNG